MAQGDTFIEEALQEYKDGMNYLSGQLPKLTKKYNAFVEACFSEGEIKAKNKYLIALAISVCMNEEYSIINHTKNCIDEDCSEEEIMEAVGVAVSFGGDVALGQAVTVVRDAIETFDTGS
ncbi:carboxymuconolactone decarboxylase family protein [Salicibibacter kimchii]|uniref:Carboxymuconolactone decarboxylase family protein n=1 Tax=Salicibibacter kimchii TaxID=2099786 RepID=A0A345BYY7_9BACI|nr:carboxymuconolactone decarboxylase family protein [Salicibibacter kimchii]AXF56168.1 carboxymuconolactone decarboxylase family protein [Salicibibacter kimchii]